MSDAAVASDARRAKARAVEATLARRVVGLCSARRADGSAVYTDEEVETFLVFAMAQLGRVNPAELEPRLQQRLIALAEPGAVTHLPATLVEGFVRILEELGAGAPSSARAGQRLLGTEGSTSVPSTQTAQQRHQSLSVLLRTSPR